MSTASEERRVRASEHTAIVARIARAAEQSSSRPSGRFIELFAADCVLSRGFGMWRCQVAR